MRLEKNQATKLLQERSGQRQDVLDQVQELQQKKMKLVLERTRMEQTLMRRIKAKEEIFKKLKDLDERKIDFTEFEAINGSD